MHELTFSLAILLVTGFITAKIGQQIKLPSVTGYICAGIILGSAGFNLITEESVGTRLDHFTQIALMLIAFGIGEHLELNKLLAMARSISLIGICETTGAFIIVGFGTYIVANLTLGFDSSWQYKDYLIIALLLGAISVATAPAATLHVLRELKASGPLTSTLLAVVAVDDGLAIIFFSIAMSIANHIVGTSTSSIIGAVGGSLIEIISSIFTGIFAGLLIDYIVQKLNRRDEMLTVGLAFLLLFGEIARINHLSPLLVGMFAGFTIINKARRDVRVFRVFNTFEPPIYVLFFTLAGAELHFSSLKIAGWIGLSYFVLRLIGKIFGANIGARLAGSSKNVQKYLGLALLPQAGVAIGLIFLIHADTRLSKYSSIISPVVLAGVLLSELFGPIAARMAVTLSNEIKKDTINTKKIYFSKNKISKVDNEKLQMVPWTWDLLKIPENPDGYIIFGVSNPKTVEGLARIATILSNHYNTQPLALHVNQVNSMNIDYSKILFNRAEKEVQHIGNILKTLCIEDETISKGIIEASGNNKTKAVLLGHPLTGEAQAFKKVVDDVAKDVNCQVIVVKFFGILHTEKILVPFSDEPDLIIVRDVVKALSTVGSHKITLFKLMPLDISIDEIDQSKNLLKLWAGKERLAPPLKCKIKRSESHVETILKESEKHDLIVMSSGYKSGLSRLFFGSLAGDIAQRLQKTMLIIHGQRA